MSSKGPVVALVVATVLWQQLRPATFDEAERLRIAPTAPVVQVDRLRGLDGTPVCFDVVVVPEQRAPGLDTADLRDASLYETLNILVGAPIHRSAYAVTAAIADPPLAKLLGTTAGTPILIGEETAYTADSVPILLGTNKYRGDAYRFEADLYRRSPT